MVVPAGSLAVSLSPLPASEWPEFRRTARASYVAALATSLGQDPDYSARQSDDFFAQVLPQGISTPGQWIERIVLPSGLQAGPQGRSSVVGHEAKKIGFTWTGAKLGNREIFYIYDIWLEPEWRGRGLGRQVMLLLKDAARDRGFKQLGLQVFENNPVALRLYESLGFTTVSRVMGVKL